MPTLSCYSDFLRRVDDLGFLPMGDLVPGLPSLSAETAPAQWHTGADETDPWRWKDLAAEEKAAAYGCILGGHKGFIAPRLYAQFYAAFHPRVELAELWQAGELNQTVWRLWQLFEKCPLLDTAGIRKLLGVSKGSGASRVDAAVRDLQRDFYLSVTGSRRKIGRDGQPYGWWINTYAPTLAWAPPAWLEPSPNPFAARQAILDLGLKNGARDRVALAAALSWETV